MGNRIVTEVHRPKRSSAKVLEIIMIVLAVIMLLAGIVFSRGFFLPCFLMAGLYFIYDRNAVKDYEYIYEDKVLTIDVIKGRVSRQTAHEIPMEDVVVVAEHNDEAVARFRKGAEEGNLPKFDYTSYNDQVPYYTMIAVEDGRRIKLLLDLDEAMLSEMKRQFPQIIHRLAQ